MNKAILFGTMLLSTTPAFCAIPLLSSINHPPMQIGTATVVDGHGTVVGAVQRVEVTPDGKPTQVAISLLKEQDKLLVLNAGMVRYDAASNQIIADTAIHDLP